jgi:ABC-type nitrate/sulfonate/bicarbonate transport system ATPase subunit/flavin-dependent dehydrogenase
MNSEHKNGNGGADRVAGVRAPGADEASSLSINDVSKIFPSPDGGEVVALDCVSLSVKPGEFVALIGESGCGKSTLLRLIAGLDMPTIGELRAGNELITRPSAERGMMFQSANLFPWLTIRRNVQAGLVARGVLRQRQQEVEELIRLVGLEAFANVYPHQVSGGMAQRAALARTLINHPKVLLLDEPLGALDQFTRMQMQDEILALWKARGMTMVMVTHYVDEAIYMADRIAIMTPRPGRIDRIIEIAAERPRERNHPQFVKLRSQILEMLHFAGPDPEQRRAARFAQSAAKESPPASTTSRTAASPATPTVKTEPFLDAEVIIIGGGPAGSTMGAYLARAGIDHIILDKAVHPRRHVGESLVCSTTRILQDIDFLPTMEREGFVHKKGASWFHWADRQPHLIRFREIPEMSITQDYTYHVDRGRFDKMLLEHAESRGSRVIQGAHVERVEFGPDGAACGVRLHHAGLHSSLRAKVIVDASGRNSVLGTQLKLKRKDPQFNQFAVHSWFEGVDRGDPETADYIHIHMLPVPRGWAWVIPIDPQVTSVGIVTEGSAFVKSGQSVEEFFARHVASNKVFAERMAKARRLDPFTREGNYSYVMDRFVGDGWMLVGDAARFVDPVFSSGVSVAMESAKRGADALIAALAKNDVSSASFADYEKTQRSAVDIWREFVLMFYRLPPLFLDLISKQDSRVQVLRLLQGEVFDRQTVPILDHMRSVIGRVQDDPAHPWRASLTPELVIQEK